MVQPHNMTDYEKTYAEFTWNVPEKYNFAWDVIDRWAEKDPQKRAMLWVDDDGNETERTFADISRASRRLCNVLAGLGVCRGDVVALMLGRQIAWWEIFTACLRMGAIIAPGTTQLTAKDLQYRINTAEAVCFITDEANAGKLEEIEYACSSLKAKIVVGP